MPALTAPRPFRLRRLDAESIRDTLLLVPGNLDTKRHGPHPFPEQTAWKFTQHNPFRAVYDQPLLDQLRRVARTGGIETETDDHPECQGSDKAQYELAIHERLDRLMPDRGSSGSLLMYARTERHRAAIVQVGGMEYAAEARSPVHSTTPVDGCGMVGLAYDVGR
jgi:hypothetical protein